VHHRDQSARRGQGGGDRGLAGQKAGLDLTRPCEAYHQRDLSCAPHCSHWKAVASLSTGACLISPPHTPPLPRLLMQLGRNERASSSYSAGTPPVPLVLGFALLEAARRGTGRQPMESSTGHSHWPGPQPGHIHSPAGTSQSGSTKQCLDGQRRNCKHAPECGSSLLCGIQTVRPEGSPHGPKGQP